MTHIIAHLHAYGNDLAERGEVKSAVKRGGNGRSNVFAEVKGSQSWKKGSSGARWEEMPADRGSRLGERAAGVVALLFPQ